MNEEKMKKLEELGIKKEYFKKHDKDAEVENALVELADLIDTTITEHENALIELAEMITEGE